MIQSLVMPFNDTTNQVTEELDTQAAQPNLFLATDKNSNLLPSTTGQAHHTGSLVDDSPQSIRPDVYKSGLLLSSPPIPPRKRLTTPVSSNGPASELTVRASELPVRVPDEASEDVTTPHSQYPGSREFQQWLPAEASPVFPAGETKSKFSSWSSSSAMFPSKPGRDGKNGSQVQEAEFAGSGSIDWGSIGPPSSVISDGAAEAFKSMGIETIPGAFTTEQMAATTLHDDKASLQLANIQAQRKSKNEQLRKSEPLECVSTRHTGETVFHSATEVAVHSEDGRSNQDFHTSTVPALEDDQCSQVSFSNIRVWREIVAVEGTVTRNNSLRRRSQTLPSAIDRSRRKMAANPDSAMTSTPTSAARMSERKPRVTRRSEAISDTLTGTANRRKLDSEEATEMFSRLAALSQTSRDGRSMLGSVQGEESIQVADSTLQPIDSPEHWQSSTRQSSDISATFTINTFGQRTEHFGALHSPNDNFSLLNDQPHREFPAAASSATSGAKIMETQLFNDTAANHTHSTEQTKRGYHYHRRLGNMMRDYVSSLESAAAGDEEVSRLSPARIPRARGHATKYIEKTLHGDKCFEESTSRGAGGRLLDFEVSAHRPAPQTELVVKETCKKRHDQYLCAVIAERIGQAGNALLALQDDLMKLSQIQQEDKTAEGHYSIGLPSIAHGSSKIGECLISRPAEQGPRNGVSPAAASDGDRPILCEEQDSRHHQNEAHARPSGLVAAFDDSCFNHHES